MLSRRTALLGGAAVVSVGAPAAMAYRNRAEPNPLREGVQALVNEIRGPDMLQKGVVISLVALQEVADRLEALPGIEPVRHETWETVFKPNLGYWKIDRHLALPGGAS